MYTQDDLNKLLRDFLAKLSERITIREAYLFGPYSQGEAGEESDIDIALVSDEFQGFRYEDRKLAYDIVKRDLLKRYYDIEIHPFRTEDFTPDNPFVKEILRTGKRIQWS